MVLNDGVGIGSPLTRTPNKNSIINLLITFNFYRLNVRKNYASQYTSIKCLPNSDS
jgi:hypothetical protein